MMKPSPLLSRTFSLLLIAALLAVPGASAISAANPPQLLQPVKDKPLAKDFRLENLDGETVSLSDFKGRVVVVNFWATWCPPCRFEIPSMQRAWLRMKEEDVMMLAVHVGGNNDKVWSFTGEFGIDFPVLMDVDSTVADAWPMRGLPSTFIVDPQGRIAYQAIGGREWDAPEILQVLYDLRDKGKS